MLNWNRDMLRGKRPAPSTRPLMTKVEHHDLWCHETVDDIDFSSVGEFPLPDWVPEKKVRIVQERGIGIEALPAVDPRACHMILRHRNEQPKNTSRRLYHRKMSRVEIYTSDQSWLKTHNSDNWDGTVLSMLKSLNLNNRSDG